MKVIYECSFCGKHHNTLDACRKCELSHVKNGTIFRVVSKEPNVLIIESIKKNLREGLSSFEHDHVLSSDESHLLTILKEMLQDE